MEDTYTAAGTYTTTFQTPTGCDSVATLNLLVTTRDPEQYRCDHMQQ